MDTKKEKRAIEYLKAFEPNDEPYYLCYSGGKDSDCIRILADLAGVKRELWHNHTTVDAPETVYYVRSIPGIHISYPKLTMWELIVKKLMPPTRIVRYCCLELKEKGGAGRLKITGVRWAESASRKESSDVVNVIGKPVMTKKRADELGVEVRENKKGALVLNTDNAASRRFVEHCYRTTSTMVNPIVDWTDKDVWEFLRHYGCVSNPLYQCGGHRVGCVGCPMKAAKGQKADFARYPKYRDAYVRAFDRMLTARLEAGKDNRTWKTGEDVMRWWLGDDPDQISIDDFLRY